MWNFLKRRGININTDVAGAISGYYKQIYIATKELMSLKNDTSFVDIECGAGVRIFHSDRIKKSIEVKFHNSFQNQVFFKKW